MRSPLSGAYEIDHRRRRLLAAGEASRARREARRAARQNAAATEARPAGTLPAERAHRPVRSVLGWWLVHAGLRLAVPVRCEASTAVRPAPW